MNANNILLVATGNRHKAEEIADIFAAAGLSGWQLRTLAEYPNYTPPEEDGDSFAANAALKAEAAALMSGLPTLADDSGLAVEALGGAPGIYSARYAADGHDDAANRAKLLAELQGIPRQQRGAAFVCLASLAFPAADKQPSLTLVEGRCEGFIAEQEAGENGFGYDSLFYLPAYDQTMAQLPPELKNRLSHRYQAMSRVARLLMRITAI